jgi:hypothetical protein
VKKLTHWPYLTPLRNTARDGNISLLSEKVGIQYKTLLKIRLVAYWPPGEMVSGVNLNTRQNRNKY